MDGKRVLITGSSGFLGSRSDNTGAIGMTYERKHDVMEIHSWTELKTYIEDCTD